MGANMDCCTKRDEKDPLGSGPLNSTGSPLCAHRPMTSGLAQSGDVGGRPSDAARAAAVAAAIVVSHGHLDEGGLGLSSDRSIAPSASDVADSSSRTSYTLSPVGKDSARSLGGKEESLRLRGQTATNTALDAGGTGSAGPRVPRLALETVAAPVSPRTTTAEIVGRVRRPSQQDSPRLSTKPMDPPPCQNGPTQPLTPRTLLLTSKGLELDVTRKLSPEVGELDVTTPVAGFPELDATRPVPGSDMDLNIRMPAAADLDRTVRFKSPVASSHMASSTSLPSPSPVERFAMTTSELPLNYSVPTGYTTLDSLGVAAVPAGPEHFAIQTAISIGTRPTTLGSRPDTRDPMSLTGWYAVDGADRQSSQGDGQFGNQRGRRSSADAAAAAAAAGAAAAADVAASNGKTTGDDDEINLERIRRGESKEWTWYMDGKPPPNASTPATEEFDMDRSMDTIVAPQVPPLKMQGQCSPPTVHSPGGTLGDKRQSPTAMDSSWDRSLTTWYTSTSNGAPEGDVQRGG
eukprot:TRINITY_DN25545_c0_g1_i1.p1 TRINITY_DN25545_c0_g1~~TRINITY_DN25545_c0_g1_i1.p1  ORF type:complete len:518 (-),score=78.09 TRINITY_DN25545_c0_g1_i1:191-1744(-)